MKIAITGITGFIGKALALKLFKQGHEVLGLVHSPYKTRVLPNGIKKFYGDIHNKELLKQVFDKCDLIYHCAALVNGSKKAMMYTNAYGTMTVCDVAFTMRIKKIIYLSSIAVISGNDGPYPLTEDMPYAAYNDYGLSKIEAEKIVKEYIKKGLNISIIRPSAVYGPSEPHVITKAIRLSRMGILPIIGHGHQKWQLIHIDDLTDFLISIINNERAYNDVFNVSSAEYIEMIELYKLVKSISGMGIIVYLPIWFVMPIAKAFEIPFVITGKKPFTDKIKFFERDHVYDISKAKHILGLNTRIPLKQGIEQTYKFIIGD